MAKDDYHIIAYKILLYLYAVLKRKISFNKTAFDKAIGKEYITDEYLADIIRMMQKQELIDGAVFMNTWGNVYILISDISDLSITPLGIEYLSTNSLMQKVKNTLLQTVDIVSELIHIVKL